MKYYISWYPNPPDPRYWEWFKIDGIMISLGSLRGSILKKALTLGLHRFTGFNGDIFLDSGAFQFRNRGTNKNQKQVLELQSWLNSDFASHLDKPFINIRGLTQQEKWFRLKQTIENAIIAKRWERERDGELTIVYVIQGWDSKSIKLCAKKLSALNADYYALGSSHRLEPSTLFHRFKLVRKIIGKKPKLHLFGVNPLRMSGSKKLEKIFSLVDSVDSSTPIQAGIVKELLDPNDKIRKHINHISQLSEVCDCPVCRKFPYEINLIGIKGSKRRYNRLRAIHNAYWLTKIAHSFSFDRRKHL